MLNIERESKRFFNQICRKALFLFFIFSISCAEHDKNLHSYSIDSVINSSDEYIAVFGDVQKYTYSEWTIKPFLRTLTWINTQNNFYNNFACVMEVGDVTNDNIEEEWKIYDDAIKQELSCNIPVFSCTGNHDYTWGDNKRINDRKSSFINQYLSHYFPDSLVKARFEPNRVDNIIVKIPFKHRQIDLIILEYAPRKEAVEWVAELVKNHPDQKYILMTHEMLTSDGEIASEAYAWSSFYSTNSTWSSPKFIIENILKPCPNVVATICGHNGHAILNDSQLNVDGRNIPIILFNLQYQKDGGDSQVLLLRFPENENLFECITYHTDSRTILETNLSYRIIEY